MERIVLRLVIVVALAVVLGPGSAAAAPSGDGPHLGSVRSMLIDPLQEELQLEILASSSGSGVQHIGPVHSTSPDSGTCGNDWANDEFDRYFTIRPGSIPGTFEVYEQFKNGTFLTIGPPTQLSPGACEETDGTPPGIIAPGVPGTMHGYLLTTVTCDPTLSACPDPSATCDAAGACDTTDHFIATFFGTAAVRNDQAWFFHYAGYDSANQTLVVHEWKNASCNRGGNHEDIATTNIGVTPPPVNSLCI